MNDLWLNAGAGLGVGILVGLTGVGGGSLMTPIMVLLFGVAAALRAQPEFGNLALVAFTAWGDKGTRQRTHDAGFDQHITKPAGMEEILRAIGSACDMRASFARKIA